MDPGIEALLLDFDGVVIESERENGEMVRAFFRSRFGIEITAGDERSVYGFPWPETFAALFERYGIEMSPAEAWPPFFASKLAWLAAHPPRLATGLAELLALPVAKALVSGSHRVEIEAMLASAGRHPLAVDLVISRDDVRAGKPDPEGFLAACARLGVPAARALVFEDSRPGIAAARAGGMPVAFVRELSPEDNAGMADVAFDTLAAAVPWVRGHLGRAPGAGGGSPSVSLVVRQELSARAPAARTALFLLAGIWIAFAAVWLVAVLALGGSILLALCALPFLPAGFLAAGRVLANAPDRWVVEVDPDRGLVAARRGYLSRGGFVVPLAELVGIEVVDRPGPGKLPRPVLRVAARTGDRWLGEGHARAELERTAAVLQEGVRSARASPAAGGTPPPT